jgi:hypothetical protein
MTSIHEWPLSRDTGPRKETERGLRRTPERHQMRLARSERPDQHRPEYPTYMLVGQSGDGPTVLDRASLQEVENYMSQLGDTPYRRLPTGERIDAVEGSIVGVMPGVVIDNLANNKRFQVMESGEFLELPDEGWPNSRRLHQ